MMRLLLPCAIGANTSKHVIAIAGEPGAYGSMHGIE